MGIKIKNLQTGEFEKFNIPALKGEKGEPGEIEPSEKVDYIGKQHSKLRDTMNANVDYIIKTAIGEFNYLDYEGQQITATNTLEGRSKSAILKGQTLVNLAQPSLRAWTMNLNSDTASLKATTDEFIIDWSKGVPFNAWIQARNDNSPVFGGMLKADTDYTFIIRILENNPTFEGVTVTGNVANLQMWGLRGYYSKSFSLQAGVTGTIALKYNFNKVATTTTQDIENIFGIAVPGTASNGTKTIDGGKLRISKDVIVLEGDYTNNYQDIPYFEGMQSVKMPVLTTTGKNLLNNDWERGGLSLANGTIQESSNEVRTKTFSKVTPITNYIVSMENFTFGQIYYYDKNYNFISRRQFGENNLRITTPDNCEYIKVQIVSATTDIKVQLEEGSQATPYEPYKSNILTVNEDVTLRGVGDVQDTLDCLTGEYVKAVYEYTFTGDEDWVIRGGNTGGYTYFTFSSGQLPIKFNYKNETNIPISCDKLPTITHSDFDNRLKNVGVNLSYFFRLNFSDCDSNNGATVEDLKAYLKANPTTVQYPISKSVKTVDLSDNHVYSYKDVTHYDCSSAEGSLVPTLFVKVPTDTQLTIQEQKATTQTLLIKNMDLQQSIKEAQAMNLAFNTVLYNSFNSIREEVEDIKKHVSTNENLEGSF